MRRYIIPILFLITLVTPFLLRLVAGVSTTESVAPIRAVGPA